MIKKFDEFVNENLANSQKNNIINTRKELDEIIKSAYEEQGKGDTLTLDFTGRKIMVDDLSYLFDGYKQVKQIIGLDTWDVSHVTDMSGMFYDCQYLKALELNNWDVSKVTNMRGMFAKCHHLTNLDIRNWDVRQVRRMDYMFENCGNLKELDLNIWDVNNVEGMTGMFYYCNNLTELHIENWDVSRVKDMFQMFAKCPVQYTKKGNKLVRK